VSPVAHRKLVKDQAVIDYLSDPDDPNPSTAKRSSRAFGRDFYRQFILKQDRRIASGLTPVLNI
jgi:hypothetical protein